MAVKPADFPPLVVEYTGDFLAGVDEVGRGALDAGHLVIAGRVEADADAVFAEGHEVSPLGLPALTFGRVCGGWCGENVANSDIVVNRKLSPLATSCRSCYESLSRNRGRSSRGPSGAQSR